MGLLPWAQEVPSSNLGAPTKLSANEKHLLEFSGCPLEWLGFDFEFRELLLQVATLDDSGFAFQDLEVSLIIPAGEADLEYMLADAKVPQR